MGFNKKKEKVKINEWMIDKAFLVRANIPEDKRYYTEKMFRSLYSVLKDVPVKIVGSFDPNNLSIYLAALKPTHFNDHLNDSKKL